MDRRDTICRSVIVFLLLSLLVHFTAPAAQTQGPDASSREGGWEGDFSADRTWGVGVRFMPSFLTSPTPFLASGELSSAAVVRFWLTPQLAVEGGGWLSGYSTPWDESSLVLLTGGLLLKLVDAERSDLYLAGRGLHARQRSQEKGIFFDFGEPPAPGPGPGPGSEPDEFSEDSGPPCCPPVESESLTLALEVAVGTEWSLSPQLAVEAELGLTYAQTATTSTWPYRPPFPEEPIPLVLVGPQQRIGEEVSTTVSWGITLHLGISFYFLPSAGGGAERPGEEGG